MPHTPTTTLSPTAAMRRICVGLVALLLLAACGDASEYPHGWSPLQAPAVTAGARPDSTASRSCPDLRGTYAIDDAVIYGNVVARFLTREQREFAWHVVTIASRGTDSLALRVVRGPLEDSVRLATREVFRCADGWMTGAWPDWVLPTREADGFGDEREYTRQLWLTRDQDGRLIGREEIVSYRHVAVWCGDGCRYFKLPGTRREEVRWHRVSKPGLAMRVAPEPEGDAAVNARIARENAALEAGTPVPPR